MKNRAVRTTEGRGRGGAQVSIGKCFRLLAKSCDRYGELKQSKAPEVIMDMERIIIWKRLMFLFGKDSDHGN